MGEYIDVGLQSSILPFTLLFSSIIVGAYALFGFEVEEDDEETQYVHGLECEVCVDGVCGKSLNSSQILKNVEE